ncbi:hypothetical protein [Pseudozobellia sp. WGM2]|uniref:hypothetical protein n=1 Tax=Pseudozobellia sp. WGM2 TaxID=2787625 RepID=UPI001AE0B124|nr:hypothetical protein [Pseudozobellia sp. WGM2]
MGKRLEKEGRVLEAKALYEANISEGFEGSFPYRRLAILYRKGKSINEEIRVLEKAVSVFQNVTGSEDIHPKLNDFKERLKKAKSLKSR